MALDVLSNYVEATVTTGGTTALAAGAVETWTVTTTENWPVLAGGQQIRVMDKEQLGSASGYEIMVVTADANGTGVSWTATRGVEGTTPVAHAADWTVVPANTGGLLNALPMRVVEFTSSGTWTVPSGVTQIEVAATGGGGGGGGAGSTATASPTGYQGAGAGGNQGAYSGSVVCPVAPGDTVTVTIGAGGAGGAGGAVGGNSGIQGGTGGNTTVTDTTSAAWTVTSWGGAYGLGSGANTGAGAGSNSATAGQGGSPGGSGTNGTGPNEGPPASGPWGGAGCGGLTANEGVPAGGGGGYGGSPFDAGVGSTGGQGSSPTVDGVNGTNGTGYGSGGGGGGGGASGGTGGNGGNGSNGYVEIRY